MSKSIKDYFEDYGYQLDKEKERKLLIYFNYLVEQNKVMNLTGITEYEDVVIKHFIDCASISRLKIDFYNKNVVDVGTGAGFPGIVLAILYPKAKFYLVDSLNKRIKFLKSLISMIDISNVQVFHSRGEDFAKEYPKYFDIGVSRAVARMSKLGDYILPLIKKGGTFIAYKGIFEIEEENEGYKTLKKYNAKYSKIERFYLTENDNRRTLVKIEL